jgi:hypothetical protein
MADVFWLFEFLVGRHRRVTWATLRRRARRREKSPLNGSGGERMVPGGE